MDNNKKEENSDGVKAEDPETVTRVAQNIIEPALQEALKKAQQEGYFKPIRFEAVFGLDQLDADQAIIDKMGEIAKEISEIPEYAEALEQGFKQPVSFLPKDKALTRLNEIRDRYMEYHDELQASR